MSEHHDEPHLPHGSVWPFWVAVGIALLGMGAIFPGVMTVIGLVALIVPLAGWFIEDHKWWKTNTGTGNAMPKAGTLLFIGSEIFLFGALFSTYFTFQGTSEHWPDTDVHLPLLKVGLFSLFLFASSGTIHVAEKHLRNGNHKGFVKWWGLTCLLGGIFLVGQVMEYMELIHAGSTLGSGHYITAFYMITGTHGLHVFGGLCALLIVFVRAVKGQFTPARHAGPESVALYWHFVDIVWIFVLLVLYVWPVFFGNPPGHH